MDKITLRAYIQSLGYTSDSLAEKLGMSKVNVNQYINDDSLAFGKKVANRFSSIGVNPQWLLGKDDKMLLDGFEFKPFMYNKENYIENLQEFFKIHKLRSGAIAKSLGISRQTWINYMNERYDIPLRVINDLSSIYGINKKWLTSKGKVGTMLNEEHRTTDNIPSSAADYGTGRGIRKVLNTSENEVKMLKDTIENREREIEALKKELSAWKLRFEKEQNMLAEVLLATHGKRQD